MKTFYKVILVVLLVQCVTSANLKRNKRFMSKFWTDDNPITEAKKDFQTGITYSQLPPQYVSMLPGVNQHLIQDRVALQQPIRYVQPQNRPIAPLPLQKQPLQTIAQQKPTQKIVMNQPIRMPPVAAIHQTATPQFQRGRDPQLPDIHKHNRFVQQKPVQRPVQIQPFSPRQQLPIQKKIFETAPGSVVSIKNTEITKFYSTKEFQDLMKEFNIKADVNKLPDIKDVMGILGTSNAEDTLKTIREVANTKDGMELIKSFLEYNNDRVEVDEFDFYEYEDDNRAGEIIVTDKVETFKQPENIQQVKNLPVQGQQQAIRYNYIPASALVDERRALATTTGEATGSGASWWKPYTWFNTGISTKLDTLQKDAEILKNVLPQTESVWDRFNYVSHFFAPTASRNSIQISPPFQVLAPGQGQPQQAVRLYSIQAPQTLPTLKMTEAEFAQYMGQFQKPQVKSVPAPIGNPAIVPAQKFAQQQYQFKDSIMVPTNPSNIVTQSPPKIPQQKQSFEESKDDIRIPQKYLEVPRESRQPEIKRNFISSSEPQRATPYDFTATGRLGRANPDAVRALVMSNEEEKSVISNISDLTEQHQMEIQDESN